MSVSPSSQTPTCPKCRSRLRFRLSGEPYFHECKDAEPDHERAATRLTEALNAALAELDEARDGWKAQIIRSRELVAECDRLRRDALDAQAKLRDGTGCSYCEAS